jgi:hypothetical protein
MSVPSKFGIETSSNTTLRKDLLSSLRISTDIDLLEPARGTVLEPLYTLEPIKGLAVIVSFGCGPSNTVKYGVRFLAHIRNLSHSKSRKIWLSSTMRTRSLSNVESGRFFGSTTAGRGVGGGGIARSLDPAVGGADAGGSGWL